MQLQIFNHKDLGQVRVIGSNQNPLFCLADVCKVLELESVNKVANAIKAEFELGELNSSSFDTGYGIKEFSMITEPQLYFVLMRSDKPKAKPFRQWVVSEVLPSIRKRGYYLNPNIESTLISELKDSNSRKDCLKRENENLKDEVITLQRKLLNLYDRNISKELEAKVVSKHYGQRLSANEKARILSLRKEGKSIRQIGQIVQRSKSAIENVLKEGVL
ncbi:antirepressor, BRO family protein [Helicobacter muridarum]|uniref:Antirepressor, BRO family protein n=1 Tax=Helicobacter muridarum TaxID=216 RepID=A0A377PW49_9HELI|nr:BRO family protein [Helicobacter muridarum]TLE00956.1 antirepressor, BRO family protein [Helicobacter muridarum]STQ86740.1 Uncharacterized phage-encoded protein [Helicobacter muridarum]